MITAFYTGTPPDNFQAEAEVTAKGRLQPDGTFLVQPDGIVAKCPSKYEDRKDVGPVPTVGAAFY